MARQPRHVRIGEVWIDCTIREAHSASAEITEHPVEQGADVADHIRILPRVVTIEGVVTNQPIELPGSHTDGARVSPLALEIEGEPTVGAVGLIPGVDQGVAILGAVGLDVRSKRIFAATPLHFTQEFDRVTAVHDALIETLERKKLIRLAAGLHIYDQVALVDVHTDRRRRDLLEFHCACRVLRIVSSQTAQIPDPVDPRGRPGRSLGKQATTPATNAEAGKAENISAAAKLLGLGD